MSHDDRQKVRQARATARLLEKLCRKMEKLCVPMQDVLMRVAAGHADDVARQRVEQFQEKLGIVTGALYVLNDRKYSPGGGVSQRLAARAIQRLKDGPAVAPAPQSTPTTAPPSLQGTCAFLPLATLLRLLARQKRSGTVVLNLGEETITLAISGGDVVHVAAQPPRRGERLGELLIEAGDVVREHLMSFTDRRSPSRHYGIALVENGIVSPDALTRALTRQAQLRLDRAFACTTCTFAFHEGEVAAATGLMVDVGEFLDGTGRGAAQTRTPELAPALGAAPAAAGQAVAKPAGTWNDAPGADWRWREDK